MNELKISFIESAYNTFSTEGRIDYEAEYFNKIVDENFIKITKNFDKQKNPKIIRVAGQSGSGKTTQLMPAIKESLDDSYIYIAIRNFSTLHPDYNMLLEKYDKSLIREKTNYFALLCFFKTFEKLIYNGYNIFFEVTLLNLEFEEYVNRLAKQYKYNIFLNILSVPFEVSNYFSSLRTIDKNSLEQNRIVPQKTLNYFFDTMQNTMQNIFSLELFDNKDYIVMWNAKDLSPVFQGNNFNKNIYDIFRENIIFSGNLNEYSSDFEKKLESKRNFYRNIKLFST